MANERPVILLAAHGERGGAARNERLSRVVEGVQRCIPEADVGSVLVNIEGLVGKTVEACGERPVLCLPLLFSDGYFYAERLKPHFKSPTRRLAPPLALWPGFAPMLADNLALRLISHSADPRVVLVAHGSKTPGASAATARKIAAQMQARYGQVEVAFLEEPPFARDVMARVRPPYSCIGLFFGEGLHGAEDFDVLVASAAAPPAAAFTAGELPGLVQLIAAEAQQRLADMVLS